MDAAAASSSSSAGNTGNTDFDFGAASPPGLASVGFLGFFFSFFLMMVVDGAARAANAEDASRLLPRGEPSSPAAADGFFCT